VISGLPINNTVGDATLTGGSSQGTFEDFTSGCSAAGAYSGNLNNGYSWLNQSCFLESVNTSSAGTATILVNPIYAISVTCTGTASSTCPAGTTGLEYATAKGGSGNAAPNGTGLFGTIQRNYLRAPGAINFDMSISRMFPIHERLQAEFRFDAFNVFNHWNPQGPSGGSPTGTTSTQTFGYITGAPLSGIIPTQYDPRVLQFALKLHF
jgi:hypothetical protein